MPMYAEILGRNLLKNQRMPMYAELSHRLSPAPFIPLFSVIYEFNLKSLESKSSV